MNLNKLPSIIKISCSIIVDKQRLVVTDFKMAVNHNLFKVKNSVKCLGVNYWTINYREKFT